MSNDGDLTYSEAIEQVMRNNGYFAPLKLLYQEIWNYKDKSKIIGKTPDFTIQERVQRDPRFTRIAKGVYALTQFLEQVEKEDLGFFTVEKNEVVFKEAKKFVNTVKVVEQKVRIGQSYFRAKLLSEMKSCPITGIDDKRLLIASHIKPWVHSNNEERVNTKNGILLSPLFDKLFDKGIGLITFTLEKKILISNKISQENIARLNISHNQELENFDINGREEFLEYHRKFIFQG
ncbi:MAG TPA: HNH endonuclease signature motif containing protein [Pyrinomonadaceae bacterium]|nr:HNH endonuclease signature motif containing protein [Pyrinomonadaceae bacterium]